MATQANTIRSILEDSKKSTWPLGLVLFKAARDVVACAGESGIMPPVEKLSPNDRGSWIIMGYAQFLLVKVAYTEAGLTEQDFKESFSNGLFNYVVPQTAARFLREFPTAAAAVKKFNKPINMSGHCPDTLAATEQLLNLTPDEARLLVSAKPLVMQFKESLLSHNAQPQDTGAGKGGHIIQKPSRPTTNEPFDKERAVPSQYLLNQILEMAQPLGWDYTKLGGMINLGFAALNGDQKAQALLQSNDVQQVIAEFRYAMQQFDQSLDPVDAAIIDRIVQLESTNDPLFGAVVDVIGDIPLNELRSRFAERLAHPVLPVKQVTSANAGPQVISIPDKRAADIRKMAVEDGLTDIQIGRKLGIGDSRVKQIRLAIGIKRKERKKSLS